MSTTIFAGREDPASSGPAGRGAAARRERRWGLLFVSPWLFGLTALFAVPIIATLVLSFTNYELVDQDGEKTRFIGLENWRRIFSDPEVRHGAWITLRFAIVFVPMMLIVPLAVAYLLTSRALKGKGFFRVLFYMPTMVPFIAVVFIWRFFLNGESGWFAKLFDNIGITMPDILNDPQWVMGGLWLIALWGIGNAFIIYIAALNGVSKDLYEAATLDGAGSWRVFKDVTFPMISPIIFYNLVLTMVALGQYFVLPFALSEGTGDPAGASRFYTLYFYRQTFDFFQAGYGSALVWMMFLVIFAVTIVLFWSARFWVHYEYEENAPMAPNLITVKEPTKRFRDLDRRTKRFVKASLLTIFAAVIVFGYLLPLVYMVLTSLKTEDQLANGRILPMSPSTVVIDPASLPPDVKAAVGETEFPTYSVPLPDGTTAKLALIQPGRRQSTFVDPVQPGVAIVWEGNWRTLQPDWDLDIGFKNYGDAYRTLDFARMLRNTAIIAGIGMAGTVIASTFVAYGLSRFRIPGKKLILATLLATIILPRFVTLVPNYVLYRKLGWIGTFYPLTVPHFFANVFNVFLLRQFFLTIPRDLDEAAAIDGAGPFKTLMTVILPQAKGAILAVALFHFFFVWNDFLEPLIFLQGKAELAPLSTGLYQFLGIYDTNIPLLQAAALMAMAIPILVFILLQRVFLRGIDLSGSLK